MSESEEVRLDLTRPCKHSVRYDTPKEYPKQAEMLRTIYIGNVLYECIGRPESITVTVRPIKKL